MSHLNCIIVLLWIVILNLHNICKVDRTGPQPVLTSFAGGGISFYLVPPPHEQNKAFQDRLTRPMRFFISIANITLGQHGLQSYSMPSQLIVNYLR